MTSTLPKYIHLVDLNIVLPAWIFLSCPVSFSMLLLNLVTVLKIIHCSKNILVLRNVLGMQGQRNESHKMSVL
jgi:hypothetical protein